MTMNNGTQISGVQLKEHGVLLSVETEQFASKGTENANQAKAILQVKKALAKNEKEREQFDEAIEVIGQVIKSGADLERLKYREGRM